MKLSQKETCGNCRALADAPHGVQLTCELGYKIERQSWYKPLEPCPKPMTWAEFYFAFDNHNKLGNIADVTNGDNLDEQ